VWFLGTTFLLSAGPAFKRWGSGGEEEEKSRVKREEKKKIGGRVLKLEPRVIYGLAGLLFQLAPINSYWVVDILTF